MALTLEDPNLIDDKPIEIFGHIFDENLTPLAGVNITDENDKTGTVSDADGRFSLETKMKNNIVFSYLGKQTITGYGYHYRGKSMVMKESTEELPAVIISGSYNTPELQTPKPTIGKSNALKYVAGGIIGAGLLYLIFSPKQKAKPTPKPKPKARKSKGLKAPKTAVL